MTQFKPSACYPSLAGRGVIVTGGASGIGAELVRAFTQQDARVGFIDIDWAAASTLVESLANSPHPPIFANADVRDLPRFQEALGLLMNDLGPVHVLINNAANDQRMSFQNITPEYWDESQAVNLRHHVFASQQLARLMTLQQQGVILNLGSVSWQRGRTGFIGYSTAKAAIHGLTRCLARELGPSGIRVNSIMPGAVLTEKQARLWRTPEETEQFHRLQALPIDLTADDIAAMALFLAADDSRGVTGQNFIVDAGLI